MRPSVRSVASCLVLVAAGTWPARAAADKVDDLSRALTSDPDFKVRLTAALVLGKLRDRRGESALVQGLADKNETVRGMSASSLGSIGDPSVAAAIEPLERDKSDYVRARAREALRILRPGGTAEAPSRGRDRRTALALGAIANRTSLGGPHIAERVREALVKQISDAQGLVLDNRPDGFVIDSSINELRHNASSFGIDVVCELSFIVGKTGSHAMVGMTSGGATVQVPRMSWHPGKEQLFLEQACEHAVASARPNLIELFQKAKLQEKK